MTRIHPTGASGGPSAFWSLPTVGSSLPLQVPRDTVAIWLDPARTTANVMIGIEGPGLQPTFMQPGDVLPIRPGTAQVWNAYKGGAWSAGGYVDDPNRLGHLAIVALTAFDLQALMTSKERQPSPIAGILYQGFSQTPFIPTHGLTGLRVSVWPVLNANGQIVTTPAADFTADVDLVALAPGWGADASVVDHSPAGVTVIQSMDEIAPPSWVPGNNRSEARLSATYLDRTWDRQVAVGSYLQIVVTAIAGAGLRNSGLFFSIEGR